MRRQAVGENCINEELYNLHSSPSIIRMNKSRRARWAGHIARRRPKMKAYTILVRKPEVKRLLGRSRRRWDDNIRIDIEEQKGLIWSALLWLRIGSSERLS
jgi:hypothetical protein